MKLDFLRSKNFKLGLLIAGVFILVFGLYYFCDRSGICPSFEKGLVYSFNKGQVKIFAEFPEGYELRLKNKELLDYYLGLPEVFAFFNLEIYDQPIGKIRFVHKEETQPLLVALNSETGQPDYSYGYAIDKGELLFSIQMSKEMLENDEERSFPANFYFLKFLFEKAVDGSAVNGAQAFEFNDFVSRGREMFLLEKTN